MNDLPAWTKIDSSKQKKTHSFSNSISKKQVD